MVPELRLFDDATTDEVHERTLRLLEHSGVRYCSSAALDVLEQAGACVDRESQIARLPRMLVEQCIGLAPAEVVLAGRDPATDCVLGRGSVYSTLDGTAAYILDHRTGERRGSTTADLAELTRVADAVDEVDVLWNAVSANDAPPNAQMLVEVATLLTHTAKHVQGEVQRAEEVPYVMDMLAAASPDGRWNPSRPIFSIVYCPVAPLQHEREMLDACMQLVRHGVPVAVYTLGLSGATAPPSLAGAVLQTNAEILSTLVLLQLVQPGAPVIYVADCGVLDMRSGLYVCAGPEAALLNSALLAMGKRYGVPVTGTGFTSDAKELSYMAGLDAALTAVTSALAGADLLTGLGMLDAAQLLSLPKLIMDAELMAQCRRLLRGMSCDEEHFLADLVAGTGPGGNYLTARETRRLLREGEHLRPRFFFRGSYDAWTDLGRDDAVRAQEEVERILTEHQALPLPDGAESRLAELVARGAAELPAR